MVMLIEKLPTFQKVVSTHARARARVCMRRGSVGQKNPLRQVMGVSNPLEGYRIPFLSSAQFECTQQDLDGPQSQALSSQEAE